MKTLIALSLLLLSTSVAAECQQLFSKNFVEHMDMVQLQYIADNLHLLADYWEVDGGYVYYWLETCR